mmetsp:Transcript_34772/g.58419  ORF Transcript_34772/g.58419 Transcript_34772/m.58419 type:complete len:262 (-) Transcript_34772:1632-2417(-)
MLRQKYVIPIFLLVVGDPINGVNLTKTVCILRANSCLRLQPSALNVRNVLPFRDRHTNETGVLLCNGPTRDLVPIPKTCVTLGMNDVVLTRPVDYLFELDKGTPGGSGWLQNHRAIDEAICGIQKFYGFNRLAPNFGPPANSLARANASLIEWTGTPSYKIRPLVQDVGRYAFGSSSSTAFVALQFALYAGFKRLYVVGCDGGSTLGHSKNIIREWVVAQDFVRSIYKNTEVMLVNPTQRMSALLQDFTQLTINVASSFTC